jgi:hypothetical protein
MSLVTGNIGVSTQAAAALFFRFIRLAFIGSLLYWVQRARAQFLKAQSTHKQGEKHMSLAGTVTRTSSRENSH